MNIGSFIILTNGDISKTIQSLPKFNKLFLITNNSSSSETLQKLESVMSNCCGSIVKTIENDKYRIKSHESISWININEEYFNLKNIVDLFKEFDYIHLALSGLKFDPNYLGRHLREFDSCDETIAVYSDYISNNVYKYLEYIRSTIYNKQDIRSVLIRSSAIDENVVQNEDLFLTIIELYKRGIIRHIPAAMYET